MRVIDKDDLLVRLRGNILVDVSSALEEAIELQPEVARWIPVSDHLPDKFEHVLITDGQCVDLGYYHGNGRTDWGSITADSDAAVVDWMPLPEPPMQVN